MKSELHVEVAIGKMFYEKMIRDEKEGVVDPDVNLGNIRHRLGLYLEGHQAALESTKEEVAGDYVGDVMYLLHMLENKDLT